MRARIKDVKNEEFATTDDHEDQFVMTDAIGEIADFEPIEGFEGWFEGPDSKGDTYWYHMSWLELVGDGIKVTIK